MTVAIIVIVVAIVLLVIAGGWWWMQRRRRTEGLREQFGTEYDRTLDQAGSRRDAEHDLADRQKRMADVQIVELSDEEANAFSGQWRDVQAKFVDRPSEAITEADSLVAQVMGRRGYPMADFDQRAADVSVDHPEVVSEYRDARSIAEKNADGGASTEDLRQAMLHYRALFDDLLGKRAA
jgi:FtsZ-interacting cell division protein ZipA